MLEVRIHGRGGQGVRLAARILGRTAFLAGYQAQDFAMYGAERRGAPVISFVRFGLLPVLERGYIFEPDCVVLLDDTLNFFASTQGLKEKGFVIINTHREPSFFKEMLQKQKLYCIDATHVALQLLNKPIANCAILGALVKKLGLPFEKLEKAIETELIEERHSEDIEKNIEAAKRCSEMIEK